MKLTTFKAQLAKCLRISLLFNSLINVKHIFHASYENFCSFKKIMQQIAYIVLYIILLDEYVLISYKMSLFRVKISETTSDARINFLHFFNLKGLGRRSITELFFFLFECRLNFNLIVADPKIG